MRFRFGWRKEHKDPRHAYSALNEDNQAEEPGEPTPVDDDLKIIIVNRRHVQGVSMQTRIVFMGDKEEIGDLYSLYLRSKGYEVLHFSSPITCALIAQHKCACPRDHVCADIIIAELDMEGMSGLDMIRQQNEKGCRSLPQNKAIVLNNFTNRQAHEAKALGCKILQKPFRLLDMMAWIKQCEQNIPSDRQLTPLNKLLETA